jgi:hypothetical protein
VVYSDFSDYFQSDAFKLSGRRCGTVRPPIGFEAYGVASDCSESRSANLDAYAPGVTYEIPVVVHIIMDSSGVGNISDSQVQSQIDILNEDYMAIWGTPGQNGTEGGIRFSLATTDPDGNPTTGITRTTNNDWFQDNNEYQYKSALGWDQTRYLNMYTNSAGGYLGYAYFPQTEAGSVYDGVVILYSAFGRDSAASPYDQGRTATHEIGHYFGLYHTFQGGCQTASSPGCYTSGDRICDTNSEQEDHYGCPTGSSTCGSADPIRNYMNYTDDTCMNNFTPEQVRRMRCALENYRSSLYTLASDLNADFSASATKGPAPLAVGFTDLTAGSVTTWSWTFGDGGTSSARNPSHTYTTAGAYTVSLTVNGSSGSDTETKTDYITVYAPTAKGNASVPIYLYPLLLDKEP